MPNKLPPVVHYLPITVNLILSHVRRARGWTQRDLADRAGLSQPQISLIERGLGPTSVQLSKIVTALDLPHDLVFALMRLPDVTDARFCEWLGMVDAAIMGERS